MASKPKKNGRPKTEIDLVLAGELGHLQCTYAEASAALRVPIETLKKRKDFLLAFRQGKERGKTSLRRVQWAHATRSHTMAIFLGKVYLKQREQEVVDVQNMDQLLRDIAEAMKKRDG